MHGRYSTVMTVPGCRAGPDRAEHFRIIPSGQGALPPPSAPRSLSGKMKGGVARRLGAGEVRGSLMER
ncbi:hypothetical protein AL037_00090 [Salipiger aestuarii]|nr:hypothetical protein C357_22245 [Citreicella sp. 357]KAA8616339.1 hypothetical protein AL037_00090 [Salipiger aestuarii]